MNNNDLAKIRTKLASQRTYLAYMRTGFSISAIAGSFKKYYIAIFGLRMIILSTAQYYLILQSINNNKKINFDIHSVPMIYVVLSIIILYLQFYN